MGGQAWVREVPMYIRIVPARWHSLASASDWFPGGDFLNSVEVARARHRPCGTRLPRNSLFGIRAVRLRRKKERLGCHCAGQGVVSGPS